MYIYGLTHNNIHTQTCTCRLKARETTTRFQRQQVFCASIASVRSILSLQLKCLVYQLGFETNVELLAGINHNTTTCAELHDLLLGYNNVHDILHYPSPLGAPPDAGSDGAFAFVSAPHQIRHQDLMQAVVVCDNSNRTKCALVSAFTTVRDILLHTLGYPAHLLHLVVVQIRNMLLSIDWMVADHIDSTACTMHVYLKAKGGTLPHLIGATEGHNSPSQEQHISTDCLDYIFGASPVRSRGNAPANAAHSKAPVAEEETQDQHEGHNSPSQEQQISTEYLDYIFGASPVSTRGNAPTNAADSNAPAAGEPNVDIGAFRQQNTPSQAIIEALLHISPIVKDAKQAETKKNRKKKRGKQAHKPQQPAKQNAFAQPTTHNGFAWDPKLIFKDGIHLTSTGFNTPIIELWTRTRVQVLTICICNRFCRAG